jgi:hypothetical protein
MGFWPLAIGFWQLVDSCKFHLYHKAASSQKLKANSIFIQEFERLLSYSLSAQPWPCWPRRRQ